MKKLKLAILLAFSLAIAFANLGCEGEQGIKGPKGPDGPDGPDAIIPIPDDLIFSIAIFNGTDNDHNGAHLLTLTFDSTASPTSSVVVANRIPFPPVIDGIDEGTGIWGPKASEIELFHEAFADNHIDEAFVRAAFDNKNVYFLVKWAEVRSGIFTVGQNNQHLGWKTYRVTDTTYEFTIDSVFEDRMALMFNASQTAFWESQGCLAACHLGEGKPDYMNTLSPNYLVDVWQWGSVRTNGLGIALDRVISSLSFQEDMGYPPLIRNLEIVQRPDADSVITDTLPIFMHVYQKTNKSYQPADPMWEYYSTPFIRTPRSWNINSRIPGWVAQIPSEGNDLIKCKGVFTNGTWVVEFSRPRRTNDRFDVDF